MTFTASLLEIIQKNENGLLGAHPSWSRVRLGDIAQILNGFAFPSSNFSKAEGKPLLRIRDILDSKTEAYYKGEYDSNYLVKPGRLVVGMDGDFNCALWKGPEALLNQRVCKVTPDERFYRLKFLAYVLPGYLKAINSETSSVTVKHLSSKTVADILLPLPSFPEQNRIVSKIEELFTKLDAGVELLKKIKAQLKRYRQAVLKYAFEGKLTEEWREEHPDVEPADKLLQRILAERRAKWEEAELVKMKAIGKVPKDDKWKQRYKEPIGPDRQNLPPLPDSWLWVSVDQVSELITDGDHNPPERVSEGIPHLTAKNVIDWTLTQKGCTYIQEQDFEKIRKRYSPKGGDVIVTCVGTIGRTAIVPDDYIFSADRNLAVVRLLQDGVNPKILQFYLNTLEAQKRIHNASGSTAQPHFYLSDLREFPVVLMSTPEQNEIISLLEEELSKVKSVDEIVESELERAESLRQSILRKAFSGELVPQDPTDEPAEKLLARIKKEMTEIKAMERVNRRTKGKVNNKQMRLF